MPANTSPIFILTPDRGINGGVRITSANTTRDLSVTTNTFILFSAGTNGSRVDAIDWVSSSTGQTTINVATVGRIFQCTDGSLSNPRLIREIALTTTTPSATAIGYTNTMTFTTPLVLPPGYVLVATVGNAASVVGGQSYDVTVYGGDY
jgi:hypothetical protein